VPITRSDSPRRREHRPHVSRRRVWLAPLLALIVGGATLRAATPAYESFFTGHATDARPAKTSGALLLSGGGGDVADAWRWFIARAGGGDIVILRASGGPGYNDYLHQEIGGVNSVETVLFHDRSAAHDPAVLDRIARAEGIFLAGGDQARYVRFWQDTPLAAALNAHVRAGKPLGGTSAGLAVLGEYSYAALRTGDLTSDQALSDPFDPQITIVRHFLTLAPLQATITDTHFSARQRLGRSLAFLARIMAEPDAPAHLRGIGVDEKTVLAVEADGSARVFSADPAGRVWLLLPTAAPQLTPGRPLTFPRVRVVGLGPQSTCHLFTPTYTLPDSDTFISVVDGELLPDHE
jgi:cyanophycinase